MFRAIESSHRPVSFCRLIWTLAVFALVGRVFTNEVFAAPIRSVTYEQFEQLVKEKAAEIPELKNLWSWRAKYHEPVYLGGGILRGLLRWIEENLQHAPLADVQRMPVPGVHKLLIQKDSDLDIFSDRADRAWFKRHFSEYSNWDILEKEFREDILAAGGTGVEKIRVSPDQVEDPLGGLRAFYDGKLNYVDIPENQFAKFRGQTARFRGNMKSNMVLRTLRFSQDLPSVEIDGETAKTLRAAVSSETHLFQPDNYWLKKTLKKLHNSTGQDKQKTLSILRDYGLLHPLAANGYALADISPLPESKRNYLLLSMPPSEVTIEDFNHFRKSVSSLEAIVNATRHMLEAAETIERIAAIMDFQQFHLTESAKAALSQVFFDSLKTMKVNGNSREIHGLLRYTNRVSTSIAVISMAISKATTAAEYLSSISLERENPTNEYRLRVSELISTTAKKFMALGPSDEEIGLLKRSCVSIRDSIAISQAALENAGTAQSFLNALQPGRDQPTEAYLYAIRFTAVKNKARFLSLNPTEPQRLFYEHILKGNARFRESPGAKPSPQRCSTFYGRILGWK